MIVRSEWNDSIPSQHFAFMLLSLFSLCPVARAAILEDSSSHVNACLDVYPQIAIRCLAPFPSDCEWGAWDCRIDATRRSN